MSSEEIVQDQQEDLGALESAEAAEDRPELSVEEVVPVIEALLLANGEPLGLDRVIEIVRADEQVIHQALELLRERCLEQDRGYELLCVAESQYLLRTRKEYSAYVRELKAGKPRRLSQPALETLAIIAYRQPIVKSDIEQIRGVDATPTLKTLLDRGIIKIVGHRPGVGQPALYGTTDEFMKLFGIQSLSQLPTLRDMAELQQDPGEVSEPQGTPELDQEAAQAGPV